MNHHVRGFDPACGELKGQDGSVYLTTALQGRIFAELNGELIHKLDGALAASPSPTEFNNIGGNSLWPAPEGGEFAFNYPPNSDAWYVQPGINTVRPELLADGSAGSMACRKKIGLVNRRGSRLEVTCERRVELTDSGAVSAAFGVEALGYRSVDTLTLARPCTPEVAVIAAWTLEQITGAEGITAFGSISGGTASEAVNLDYYGDPLPRLNFHGDEFTFILGGTDRLQIGLDAKFRPRLIGAWDPARQLLTIRTTPTVAEGRYINIADNAQPAGVYSARDQYSIFNGGPLNFFELETIAPVQFDSAGQVTGSRLESVTIFHRGAAGSIRRLLREHYRLETEIV